jgi:CII-binding regulator of phage lambda lysogenization HflD
MTSPDSDVSPDPMPSTPLYIDKEHATLEARIRIEALENSVKEIQRLASESRVTNVSLTGKLEGLTEWQRRQNGDITELKSTYNSSSAALANKLDLIRDQIQLMHDQRDKEIDKITNSCTGYEIVLRDLTETTDKHDERVTKLEKDAITTGNIVKTMIVVASATFTAWVWQFVANFHALK